MEKVGLWYELLNNLKIRAEAMKQETKTNKRRKKTRIRKLASSAPNKPISLKEVQSVAVPGSTIRLHRSGSIDIRVPGTEQNPYNPITTPRNRAQKRQSKSILTQGDLHNRSKQANHYRNSTVSSRNRSNSPPRKYEVQ